MLEMFKMFETKYVEEYEKFGENDIQKIYYVAIYLHQKLIEHTDFPPHSCKDRLENCIKRAIKLIELGAPFIIVENEFRNMRDCVERLNIQYPTLFPKGRL